EQDEVVRQQHRVVVETLETASVHARDAEAVAGDADEPRQPLVPRANERLQRAAGAVGDLPLVLLDEVVQLDEVDMVDAEPLERQLEAGARAGAGALAGLGGEEELVAARRQPWRQPQLGVAVAGR